MKKGVALRAYCLGYRGNKLRLIDKSKQAKIKAYDYNIDSVAKAIITHEIIVEHMLVENGILKFFGEPIEKKLLDISNTNQSYYCDEINQIDTYLFYINYTDIDGVEHTEDILEFIRSGKQKYLVNVNICERKINEAPGVTLKNGKNYHFRYKDLQTFYIHDSEYMTPEQKQIIAKLNMCKPGDNLVDNKKLKYYKTYLELHNKIKNSTIDKVITDKSKFKIIDKLSNQKYTNEIVINNEINTVRVLSNFITKYSTNLLNYFDISEIKKIIHHNCVTINSIIRDRDIRILRASIDRIGNNLILIEYLGNVVYATLYNKYLGLEEKLSEIGRIQSIENSAYKLSEVLQPNDRIVYQKYGYTAIERNLVVIPKELSDKIYTCFNSRNLPLNAYSEREYYYLSLDDYSLFELIVASNNVMYINGIYKQGNWSNKLEEKIIAMYYYTNSYMSQLCASIREVLEE